MATVVILLKDKASALRLSCISIALHDWQHLRHVQLHRHITWLILIKAIKDQLALEIPSNAGPYVELTGANFELLLSSIALIALSTML
jgi:hypothetical protein